MHSSSGLVNSPVESLSSSFLSLSVRPCFEFVEERLLLSATVIDPALAQNNAAQAAVQVSALGAVPNKIGWDGVASTTTDTTETGTRYRLFDYWGGTWVDAEKQLPDSSSAPGTGDDFMCWAAAASNVLQWTGWGAAGGITNTDQIFKYFQDHWTDEGNLPTSGYEYWFDGTNPTASYGSGWSRIDVAGGGNFYPTYNYGSYVHSRGQGTTAEANAMADINAYSHAGYGIAIGVFGGGGHAITVWGYNYDSTKSTTDTGYYTGIWVTDSDDNKNTYDATTAPDVLHYYGVSYSGGRYYLQNFYGTSGTWYIGEVDGLDRRTTTPPADDYANAGDYANAAAIAITSNSGSISGTIGTTSDTDLFKFVAAGTNTGTIKLTPSSTLNGTLTIFNSSGTQIAAVDAASTGGAETASVALTAGQTYYVLVGSSAAASTGTYSLAITSPATPVADDYANAGDWAHAAVITQDATGSGSITGSLEVKTDTDLFKFVAAKTGNATLTLTPSSSLDGVMKIYNSSGTLLKSVDTYYAGGVESTSIALTAGQTYYVCVSAYQSASTGTYTLTVKGAVNQAPTLTIMNTLTGAKLNTPFTITYDMLAAAGNEADPNGDPISFRIESVTSGKLTKNGVAVVPGSTLVAKGESLVWTPATNASGTLSAFTVRAWDGALASASPVQVKVAVSKKVALAGMDVLGTAPTGVAVLFDYNTMAKAAIGFDSQGGAVKFRVESLGSGQVYVNGKLAKAGTLIGAGDSVLWVPASGARDVVTAFSVSATDGQDATASVAVRVQLRAAPVLPWGPRINYYNSLFR